MVYLDESISVKYTEGYIPTSLVSDVITLGKNTFDTYSIPSNTSSNESMDDHESRSLFILPNGIGAIGLTNDISGDSFLSRKEDTVPGFLGASQRRFEADSKYKTHVFSEIVRKLATPVFSLAFADTWGTLTLGGPDPSFYSEPLVWVKTLPDEAAWVTEINSRIDLIPHADDTGSDLDFVETELDRVWFDSGTTFIWGDSHTVQLLNEWMGADAVTGQVNCSSLPNLGKIAFSIGGEDSNPSLRLELTPSEYIIGKRTSRRCFSALYANAPNKNHWIFGLYLLRKYYTVYHFDYGLIGIE
ncbi:hypothetical protein BGZ76_011084 [Entomortierella beljakovae]|nr:hypothetical protein BGZ76_011084 [Entomortierella beljakovae]